MFLWKLNCLSLVEWINCRRQKYGSIKTTLVRESLTVINDDAFGILPIKNMLLFFKVVFLFLLRSCFCFLFFSFCGDYSPFFFFLSSKRFPKDELVNISTISFRLKLFRMSTRYCDSFKSSLLQYFMFHISETKIAAKWNCILCGFQIYLLSGPP